MAQLPVRMMITCQLELRDQECRRGRIAITGIGDDSGAAGLEAKRFHATLPGNRFLCGSLSGQHRRFEADTVIVG